MRSVRCAFSKATRLVRRSASLRPSGHKAQDDEWPAPFPSAGIPLAIDDAARSADTNLPAFLARPEGAPVYHGFPVLKDVEFDGFRLGVISDFEREESTWGDAFVVAPDGSRGGLVWVTEGDDHWSPGGFDEVIPIENHRWGVWQVALPYPMRTREDARRNLEEIVPKLKRQWLVWRDSYQR